MTIIVLTNFDEIHLLDFIKDTDVCKKEPNSSEVEKAAIIFGSFVVI